MSVRTGECAHHRHHPVLHLGAAEGAAKQAAANPDLVPWVAAVKAAKGRTSDNLGTKYPKISEPMWGAIQAALRGSKSPADAMKAAQATAASAQ